jgi:lysophospholipase L1-like esterase
MNTRRTFIKSAALCGSLLGFPAILAGAPKAKPAPAKEAGALQLQKGDIILFQGDSITDSGRKKGRRGPNDFEALGRGYALHTAAALLDKYADKDLKIFNRGISGHKVPDLANRWKADTIALKPTVLSLLIGVNDYWHRSTHGYQGTVETYETGYRELLKLTRSALPKTRLVLCEPFALNTGKAVSNAWFPEFDAYRAVVKKLAAEFKAVFVPFQKAFDDAAKRAPEKAAKTYWSDDGVHASLAGAHLMANTWLQAVK